MYWIHHLPNVVTPSEWKGQFNPDTGSLDNSTVTENCVLTPQTAKVT